VVDSGLSVLRQFTEKGQAVYQGSTSAKDVDKKAIANVLPEVVTFSFYGVSLPANVDNNIVQYYNTLLTKMLEDPVFIDKIKGLNLTPVKSSVNVGDIIKKQLQVYGPIAKKLQK
jgi:hypothetical protein